jgi:cysteine desulfurase/selenocysteine lyase
MEQLLQLAPLEGGGGMIERVELTHSSYAEPPLKFEAGTPNISSVIALKSSLDLLQEIGLDWIAAHEGKLLAHAKERLSQIEGVRFLGRGQGPILSFTLDGAHPLDVATLLDFDEIAVRSGHLCAQTLLRHFGCESALRISFGLYNTQEDVERFAKALTSVLQKMRQ